MRIIKLEVERYGDRGIKLVKYAVSLDLKRYSKIGRFVAYVQKICKLDHISYDLELDEFLISKHDKTKALKENVVYKLKIRHSSKKDYQIRSSQVEESDDDIAAEGKQRALSNKRPKAQQKIAKIVRKRKQESSSESDSSSSSSEEEHSSSSQSSQSSSQSQVKPKRQRKVREEVINKSSSSEESNLKPVIKRSKQQTPKKNNKKIPQKAAVIPQRKALAPLSSSDSSLSEQSQQELPTLTQSKRQTAPVKAPPKVNVPAAQVKQPAKAKQANNLYINPQKKAVINGDSSSESEPSQYQPKKKPEAHPQLHPKTENNQQQSSGPVTEGKPKNQVKIPPALRNKLAKKNFDQHKENQWICIDKQKLKKWQELGNKSVCQANNKIRFKIIELDQQKFIPVKSGWISGQVKQTRENGVIILVKVEQQGKPYRQTFEIPEHNMDELQVNRLLATKQQIECFEQKQQSFVKQAEKPVQQNKLVQVNTSNDKNSLEKFVCGQANYYFSDKNYKFDLFMQMHANRHPEKYINLSILLNFPKIKKVLTDPQKLYEYLKSDEKYEQRCYEIDFENRLIRKKVQVPIQTKNLTSQLAKEQPKESGQIKPQ